MLDTIFAVSSGRPPAAIAVIRISGPAALPAASALTGSLPPTREARVRTLRDPSGLVLDRAMVLVFPGPATATGEDVVELHCHGGRAVVAAVERTLATMPNLRPAEPGEFTRRALTNGRIDLAEAEGLADLLAAETERQRRAAMTAAEGHVGAAVRGWMARIATLSARVEAVIDYADESDVVQLGGDFDQFARSAALIGSDIEAALAVPPVERLRDGISVVIAGRPNAGKSTLLNLLVEREAAIVTPIAGTTRDRVDVAVQRDGIPFLLSDTAGLTETDDPVERIGVDRARSAIATADILVWLDDAHPPRDAIWLHGKADLPGRAIPPSDAHHAISATNLGSIEMLWDLISQRADRLIPAPDRVALNQRQRRLCDAAAEALMRDTGDDLILLAENLRSARVSLAELLGESATEAMLDALFGQFCIGK